MPRRKRTTAQNERQRKVRRTDNNEDTLVISDSENEEEDDCSVKSSSRAARWRERESRVQIQDMTEDEMLDLAMRLSKQEANTAAQRQQLEDDDMRKAIAESLHVSQCQDSEADSEPINPMPKSHQDSQTVAGRFRCKLSFPNKNEMHSANSSDHAAVGVSGVDDMLEASPLPPMPDLSQKTLSHPPSLCPTIPSVPSTSSQQECPSSQSKDEVLDADSSEDKPSQSNSQLERSPVFLWQNSTQLGQDMLNTSGSPLSTNDHTPDLTQPNSFQLAQSPISPKSPVFAKTDPKGGTELSGNKDSDIARSPNKEEENAQEASSHKSPERRDRQKRLSLYRKAQPLTRVPVPDGNDGGTDVGLKQEALAPNQRKDESTHGSSINSVFERLTNSGNMLPEQSFQDLTTHMILHLSDGDDDDDDEEGKVVVPSPVFHQESVSRARPPNLSPTQPCSSLLTATTTVHTLCQSGQESKSQDVLHRIIPKTPDPAESDQSEAPRKWGVQDSPACDSQLTEPKGEHLVSYYWGVPFCPRGQNPDDYTRVILSQLEVYEKSLKAAQRGLLHKVDWGLPVFPCPVERSLGRRLKRHRAPRLLGEDEEEEYEERQQQGEKKAAEEAEEERVESQAGSDVGAGNGPIEPYVVVSSPEVQDELTQKSPLLFGQPDCMDAFKPSRKPSPRHHSPVQQSDECDEGQQKQCDVESIICSETQLTEDSTPELMVTSPVQPQSRADSEIMEVEEEGSAPAVDDERMEQERAEEELQGDPVCPQSPTMACPMCGRFFPRSKIEVHAAYCDGTTEQQVPVRHKRTGKLSMGGASPRSEKSEGQEKCYVCLKFFSHEEYVKHIEQCLQQKTSRPNQGNGLLVALDQTEKGHVDDYGAEPSDAIQHNRGLADPLAVAEAGGSGSASNFCVSSSPIKSFTPVSEATDCLIDFKQQYSARPSQRLGRKRKFKR